MKSLAESLTNSLTITGQGEIGSSIGTVLGRIGCGKPLMVSAALSELRPEDTDHRLQVCLERISGRRPALLTRLMMPNDGPSYSVVDQVRWDCPREKLPEVVRALEGAFKSAPEDRIASELFKLRVMTRAREQRTEEMQEAEAVIWIEQLRTYPGDIVLDVLKKWAQRPNGQWWPTWHEVQAELQKRSDRRQALLNFVRQLAERPEPMKAITDQPPTAEQRAKASDHWHQSIRPELQEWRDEAAKQKAKETPEQALERLMAEKDAPVAIGGHLAKKIDQIKEGA